MEASTASAPIRRAGAEDHPAEAGHHVCGGGHHDDPGGDSATAEDHRPAVGGCSYFP